MILVCEVVCCFVVEGVLVDMFSCILEVLFFDVDWMWELKFVCLVLEVIFLDEVMDYMDEVFIDVLVVIIVWIRLVGDLFDLM